MLYREFDMGGVHELGRLSLKLQKAINIFKFWSLLENPLTLLKHIG